MSRPNNNILPPDINEEAKNYFAVHEKRYGYLLERVRKVRQEVKKEKINILDIGPSVFTKILEQKFSSDDVFSLGLEHEGSRGGHLPQNEQLERSRFFSFNLNDTQYSEKWLSLPGFDIIIMAEVIEHLYTSPLLVLRYLHKQISPGGYLIIQTPNAAALKNRIVMLIGKNPFRMIRENADNPGHFREYTIKELINLASQTGFDVVNWEIESYFNPRNLVEKMYVASTNLLPQKFRDGITIVLRKIS